MSCTEENNLTDSDDELPSLAERIQNLEKSQNVLHYKEICDDESEDETEFLNLIEKISITPQIAVKRNEIFNKENVPVHEFLNSSGRAFKIHPPQVKSSQNAVVAIVLSDSDDEEEFLKFSERIHNTPYSQNRNPAGRDPDYLMSEVPEKKKLFSDSSLERHSKSSVNDQVERTPLTQINSNQKRTSNAETGASEFLKPLSRDYKTPQIHVKCQSTAVVAVSSDSEDEEEFFKFSERIRNTPRSQIKIPAERYPDSSISDVPEKKKFSNSSLEINSKSSNHDQIKRTAFTVINSNQKRTSNAETGASEFLKPLNRDYKTPQIRVKCQSTAVVAVSSDSEDEEDFFKFSERIRNTPRSQMKIPAQRYPDSPVSDVPEKKKLFSNSSLEINSKSSIHGQVKRTALTQINSNEKRTSNDEKGVSEFLKPLSRDYKTPRIHVKCQSTAVAAASSDSEDEEFFKFLEGITPRSQMKNPAGRDPDSSIADAPEKKKLFSDSSLERNSKSFVHRDPVQDTQTFIQSTNVHEYEILFPAKETSESFIENREEYAHLLFDFFNKKIFDSQLPTDLPLIWDSALQRTAGLTVSSMESNLYESTIKLSTGLLTSFDRLQETLLHEMCHAAVWNISKDTKVGHGPLWQIWAARCTWILPFLKCPERCHNYDGNFRFWYYCPKCNWKLGRCRQSEKYAKGKCKKCKTPIAMTFDYNQ